MNEKQAIREIIRIIKDWRLDDKLIKNIRAFEYAPDWGETWDDLEHYKAEYKIFKRAIRLLDSEPRGKYRGPY